MCLWLKIGKDQLCGYKNSTSTVSRRQDARMELSAANWDSLECYQSHACNIVFPPSLTCSAIFEIVYRSPCRVREQSPINSFFTCEPSKLPAPVNTRMPPDAHVSGQKSKQEQREPLRTTQLPRRTQTHSQLKIMALVCT